MQATKHIEQVCTPIQLKLNTIVDNTTIALKSQLNALFADLLVESEEYNETKSILLTLPIVKKLISASAYVAALNQSDAEPVLSANTMNISQTCTFNYDSLNHITPPKIDEVEDEVPELEIGDISRDEQEEADESSIKESLTVMEPPDVKEALTVIDEPSLSTEDVKENICLEIIEPDDEEDEQEDVEDEEDEPDEEEDEQDEELAEEVEHVVEPTVEETQDEQEEEQDDDDNDDEEEVEEDEQDDDEEEVEAVEELEKPKTEETKTEVEEAPKEEESDEEEEPSSEEELVTEEETKEESEDESEGEEEEDDGEEVFEIDIFGKTYYTNNATNGDIYSVDENGDPGDEVGKFVNGIATFAKK